MILFKVLPFIFLWSCQDFNSNSNDKDKFGEVLLTGSSEFKVAYPIIQNRCTNCHSSNVHTQWASFTKETDWSNQGLVIPNDPNNSPFIFRIINHGGVSSDMPAGGSALPNGEYNKLVEWVSNFP